MTKWNGKLSSSRVWVYVQDIDHRLPSTLPISRAPTFFSRDLQSHFWCVQFPMAKPRALGIRAFRRSDLRNLKLITVSFFNFRKFRVSFFQNRTLDASYHVVSMRYFWFYHVKTVHGLHDTCYLQWIYNVSVNMTVLRIFLNYL